MTDIHESRRMYHERFTTTNSSTSTCFALVMNGCGPRNWDEVECSTQVANRPDGSMVVIISSYCDRIMHHPGEEKTQTKKEPTVHCVAAWSKLPLVHNLSISTNPTYCGSEYQLKNKEKCMIHHGPPQPCVAS